MTDLFARLPKSELHLHLRGAMPVDVFTDLLNKYPAPSALSVLTGAERETLASFGNIRPFMSTPPPGGWTVQDVSRLFETTTFPQFLYTFAFTRFFIRVPDDLRQLLSVVLENLKAQNIVYAEITVSIKEYLWPELQLGELIECLEEATNHPGIQVRWIVDLVRNNGVDGCMNLLRDVVAFKSPAIAGITLGGAEHEYPAAPFADVYRVARDNGLHLSVHAGEAEGPQSVWDSLNLLGVERVGHGVRAWEDPALVEHLARNGVPLEVCPTSNLRTGVYSSYEEHPIQKLHDAGVPVTLNSDDPTFFGANLLDEYALASRLGLSDHDLYHIARNGFHYAFLPGSEKAEYLHQLDAAWHEATGKPAWKD